jgi:hypothetical protein
MAAKDHKERKKKKKSPWLLIEKQKSKTIACVVVSLCALCDLPPSPGLRRDRFLRLLSLLGYLLPDL